MQIMKGMVRIISDSSLIGKTVDEIEKEYGVKVITAYNPFPAPPNAKNVNPQDRIYKELCLEIEGSYSAMRKISLASVALE